MFHQQEGAGGRLILHVVCVSAAPPMRDGSFCPVLSTPSFASKEDRWNTRRGTELHFMTADTTPPDHLSCDKVYVYTKYTTAVQANAIGACCSAGTMQLMTRTRCEKPPRESFILPQNTARPQVVGPVYGRDRNASGAHSVHRYITLTAGLINSKFKAYVVPTAVSHRGSWYNSPHNQQHQRTVLHALVHAFAFIARDEIMRCAM